MALFDEIFTYYPDRFLTPGLSELSPAEGVITLLLAAVMTDTVLSNNEIEKITNAISRMRLFRSYSEDEVGEILVKIGGFYRRYGARPVIEAATEVVSFQLRKTVFAIAADLVLADRTSPDGATTLMRMGKVLGIPPSAVQRVITVMRIKNRG